MSYFTQEGRVKEKNSGRKLHLKTLCLLAIFLSILPSASAVFDTPDVLLVQAGVTDAGNVASLQTADTNWLNVSELAGDPALEEFYNYTSLGIHIGNTWNFSILGSYVGNPAHDVYYYVYNYTATDWIQLFQIPDSNLPNIYYSTTVISSADLVSGGVLQTMINHTSSGVNTNDLYVDYAPIIDMNITPCTLTINEPENKNYTYSINLPIDVVVGGNADTCVYTITDFKFNSSLPNRSITTKFDVDYDGQYNFTYRCENGTCHDSTSIIFGVDRSEFEVGQVQLVIGVLVLILALGFALLLFSSYFQEEIGKIILMSISIVTFVVAIKFALLSLREYAKIPTLLDTLAYLDQAYVFIIIFMIMYMIFMYMIFLAGKFRWGGRRI